MSDESSGAGKSWHDYISVGDMISLGTALLLWGVMYAQLQDARTEIIELRQAKEALQREVAFSFVRREDYRDDIREVKDLLQQMNQKLDRKVDKP